jgi:hypothetical protein
MLLAAGVSSACLLLTGCFDYSADVKVNEDGSGSMRLEILIDTERAANLDLGTEGSGAPSGPKTPQETCAEFLADSSTGDAAPAGLDVETTNEPDRCSLVASVSWAAGENPQDKLALFDSLDDEPASESTAPSEPLVTLEQTRPGSWEFVFRTSGLADDGAAVTGGAASEDAGLDMFVQMLGAMAFEGKTLRVAADLPGEVVEHNGSLQDGIVVWEVPMIEALTTQQEAFRAVSAPASAPDTEDKVAASPDGTDDGATVADEVAADSNDGAAKSSQAPWLIGGIAGVLCGFGAALLLRRRR